ncbi:MAG: NUDIX hydrolase [Candidatus Marinimicrobia bacterium]|nr:NUDIX hydrolase [Candidatus Neomarinimicrobiota bacterium]
MHRNNIIAEIESYISPYPHEMEMKKRMISFIRNHNQCFDRELSIGHITGSAWIQNTNRDSVLLMHHRKLDKWLQLGGHADGNSNIKSVALKEAQEESGLLKLDFSSNAIFDLDIHLIPARSNEPEHFHYDIRYHLFADDSIPIIKNHESFDLEWIPLNQVQKYTAEESILRMVEKSQSQ